MIIFHLNIQELPKNVKKLELTVEENEMEVRDQENEVNCFLFSASSTLLDGFETKPMSSAVAANVNKKEGVNY